MIRKTKRQLQEEIKILHHELNEAQATLTAIRNGEVDALVVAGPHGEQIFTLKSADYTYRTLIERMKESALVINANGIILYANHEFVSLSGVPMENVIGSSFFKYLLSEDLSGFKRKLIRETDEVYKGNKLLKIQDKNIPVFISLVKLEPADGMMVWGVVLTDLSQKIKYQETLKSYKQLEFLSSGLSYLLKDNSLKEIFNFVSVKINSLIKKGFVIVSEYDQASNSTIVRSVAGDRNKMAAIEKMLGAKLLGFSVQLDLETKQRFKEGKFTPPRDLLNATNGWIPEKLAYQIEESFNIGRIYVMPFVLNHDIIGTVTVLINKNEYFANKSLVEAFINQAAIALKRKKIQLALDLNIKKSKKLLSSNFIGIVISDLEYILSANKTFRQMLGFTKKEIKEKMINWVKITPAEFKEADEKAIAELKERGECTPYQKEFIKKDGSRLPVIIGASVTQKNPFQSICYILDNTKQKEYEQDLQKLATIVETSEESIISINLLNKVLSWNKGAEKLYGWRASQMIGRSFAKIIPRERRDGWRQILEKIKDNQAIQHLETVRQKKDKTIIDVSTTVTPLKKPGGKVISASIISRDISSRKERERKKDTFISVASHELKTPLTSIKAFGQILERHFKDSTDSISLNYLANMNKQINVLSDYVSDLLDVSKIQTGKLPLNISRWSIEELVWDTVKSIKSIYRKHDFIIDCRIKTKVHADRERINQVLNNLLTNAVKYSPSADKIIISVGQKNNEVIVSVKDFGIGIEENNLDKIFQRFYQVEDLNRKQFGGLGLGLYISKGVIERHRGHIWAESKIGRGSTFYFTLPKRILNN